MTQRDDMRRVVGGGFRIGNSCTPVVDSCQCMAKPIQYCKVKIKNKLSQQCQISLEILLSSSDFLYQSTYGKLSERVSCSVVSGSATPGTEACQVLLSMGFPGLECWSGLPFLPPGDTPDPGIEPSLQIFFYHLSHQGRKEDYLR